VIRLASASAALPFRPPGSCATKGRAPRIKTKPSTALLDVFKARAVTVTREGADHGTEQTQYPRNRRCGDAVAAASKVFAQQPGQGRAATKFYEKAMVRIDTRRSGSGFRPAGHPGGGLNSRISNCKPRSSTRWRSQNDFRCITMDQRNATGGESTGPIPLTIRGMPLRTTSWG